MRGSTPMPPRGQHYQNSHSPHLADYLRQLENKLQATPSQNQTWPHLDKIVYFFSLFVTGVLIHLYFSNSQDGQFLKTFSSFIQSISANTIPILLTFLVSYKLFRDSERQRASEERKALIRSITENVLEFIDSRFYQAEQAFQDVPNLLEDLVEKIEKIAKHFPQHRFSYNAQPPKHKYGSSSEWHFKQLESNGEENYGC